MLRQQVTQLLFLFLVLLVLVLESFTKPHRREGFGYEYEEYEEEDEYEEEYEEEEEERDFRSSVKSATIAAEHLLPAGHLNPPVARFEESYDANFTLVSLAAQCHVA